MRIVLRILWIIMIFVSMAFGQSGEIAPGDNLIVEGVPKIPASLAERVRRYTESRSAFLSSWHPTRREMLIGTRFGETPQLHLVKFPGGARTQLTFYQTCRRRVFQPEDGRPSGLLERHRWK